MKTAEDAKLFDYMAQTLALTFAADNALSIGDAKSYAHFKALEDEARSRLLGDETRE
jgi:hypothetical protein